MNSLDPQSEIKNSVNDSIFRETEVFRNSNENINNLQNLNLDIQVKNYEKLKEIVTKLKGKALNKNEHLILEVHRQTNSLNNLRKQTKNELGCQEYVYSIVYRFEKKSFDKKKFYLRACPVAHCILHARLFHHNVPKGQPLPIGEITEDEVKDFKKRVSKLIDYDESKDTRFQTGLPSDCLLISRKKFNPKDTKFTKLPQLCLMGKTVSIAKLQYCIKNKMTVPKYNVLTLRHDPKCNTTRCLNEEHHLGFGTAKEQAQDKKIAGTYYRDEEKRKKVEKLIKENKKSRKEIAKETNYKVQSIDRIRRSLRGNVKIPIVINTPEYQKKARKRLNDRIVEKKDGCFLLSVKFLNWEGRPKAKFAYLGKTVFPYTASWALEKNKGELPPKFTDGEQSVIMHNDEICVHRPNCINPAHLHLGNRTLNNQTRKRNRTGEKNHNAVFSDQDRTKILQLHEQDSSVSEICSKFEDYTYQQIKNLINYQKRKIKKQKLSKISET